MHIILIEPEPKLVRFFTLHFDLNGGHQVTSFENVEPALDHLPADVVLMEVDLPGEDGLKSLHDTLRPQHPNQRIVVFNNGKLRPEVKQAAEKFGCGYVAKFDGAKAIYDTVMAEAQKAA